jgi:hypothetical protein
MLYSNWEKTSSLDGIGPRKDLFLLL